jgi:nucleoside-diphosphate-sugar epimerase
LVIDGKGQNVRTVVIAPSLIYGHRSGVKPNSIRVPWLVDLAKKHKCARHIGPGENVWSNVHIDDLVDLYVLALEKAPAGSFYPGPPQTMTIDEASKIWGAGAANYTMGSNSKIKSKRARAELGWAPKSPSLLDDLRS